MIAVSARNGALGALSISYTIRLASGTRKEKNFMLRNTERTDLTAFQWSIRNLLDVESQMVAVERLLEYADTSFPMEPVEERQEKVLLFCDKKLFKERRFGCPSKQLA